MRIVSTLLLLLLSLLTLGFVAHAFTRPFEALQGEPEAMGRFWHPDDWTATAGLFLHMATGAIITFLVPLQLIPALRRRAPNLHRLSGRVLIALSLVTATGGLGYIARQGTIGGAWMSGWFALYGGLMILAAVQTLRHARARRFGAHGRWALRLMVLAVASFLYRVHYGIVYGAFDGGGSLPDFTGPFDRANVWAFYVPYLLVLEAIFLLSRERRRRAQPV